MLFRTMWATIAVVLTCTTWLPGSASAISIVGTSEGSFSGLSSCDNLGGSQNCRVVDTAVNGPNTQVQWGSTSSTINFQNSSTLTAADIDINVNTNANDVKIAQLDWFNAATLAQWDLNTFYVDWTLAITFTQPNASGDIEVFNLKITNPLNPPGDNVSGLWLGDLSNLSFSLAGVTVTDLKYSVLDGPGGSGSGQTSLTFSDGKGNWYNAENNNATLLITADFNASTSPSIPVAAPGTLMLLGGALAGISVWGWLKQRRR